MAAGPADAFQGGGGAAASSSFHGFVHASSSSSGGESSSLENLWSVGSNIDLVATASTGASWVDEVHNQEPLEKRLEEIRRKFHRGRLLQIKHLPREVTEEEVRELLSDWDVQSVTIQSGSARVSLCAPEVLEDWDRNAVLSVRGQRVTILPSLTEMLLCVGRLPLTYSEAQFNSLVSSYGEVRRVFLMISEHTGESKGYGFVEYVTKEAALQAKNALDGKRLLEWTAVCDWLDSSHITVRSLHSKCLYVDRLPHNYRDMGEFRRVFSTIVNPPYCQIALKNGCPQDWGLVEFVGDEEAEKSQQNLDGYCLHGSRIRVAYYIPGVRAINLYLKLLNDGGANKGKSALLPDPPAPAVFHQLQSLAKQNPVFAQNLQTIIMQQIQELQKGKQQQQQVSDKRGQGGPPSFQKPSAPPQFSPSSSSSSCGNKSAQALSILLASQMHGNVGGGQISPNSQHLQNQQLLAALQAMSQGGGGNGGGGGEFGNLLGLATPPNNNNGGHLEQHQQNNFYGQGGQDDQQWNQFKCSNRSTPVQYKSPLLPSPSSPSLDVHVPMDTGTTPKTPPGNDPLQAVWYSLFGQDSGGGGGSPSSGNSSPQFMKNNNSSQQQSSPIGRSADALFGGMNNHQHHQQYKNTPPGFSPAPQQQQLGGMNNHYNNQGGRGMNGELQEALNTLLNNPQMFGGQEQQYSQQMRQQPPQYQRQNNNCFGGGGEQQGGHMPTALLDLLMQSMKGDGESFKQQQHPSWSSAGGSPPSPIGNNRGGGGGNFLLQPQRSGSNGSSEMSSPRSPTYSPFSRNSSNKGLLESGNGNVSPTSQWSSAVLGSPPDSGGFSIHHPQHHFNNSQRNIWGAARSLSPGATSLNNNNNMMLINPLGIKRKQDGGGGGATDQEHFLLTTPPPSMTFHLQQQQHHEERHHLLQEDQATNNIHHSHYADSYYKKKKKN